MTRMIASILMMVSVLCPITAQAYEQKVEAPEIPELRVVLGPEQALATNGYVGGQLVMRVQLISRYPFAALDFKIPQISGVRTVELLRPRTRKVTSYAGEGYVFETAVAVLPSTAGVLTLPPVTAIGSIEPEKDREVAFDVASAPINIKIAGIPQSYDSDWWLAAHRIEIEETWSTPPEEIRAGEVVTRSVSIRAWGVTEDQLPELEHRQTTGISVSLASMNTGTERSPDGLIATAHYTWDILVDQLQVAFIAPLGVTYWHPVEHRQLRAGVPALRIEPLPANSNAIADSLMREATESQARMHLVILIVFGVFAVPVVAFLIAYLMTVLPSRSDLRLLKVSRTATTPADSYRLLNNWLVENQWQLHDFDQRHTARKSLSNQIFAKTYSAGSGGVSFVSEALAYSRHRRSSAFVFWLSKLLGFTHPQNRL